eukprot:7378213-Prymnesium_polylepis.1
MLIFPTILAASMHKGITATMVSEAIKKHPDSPTHIFLPDMWKLVVKYSRMPAHTLLKDVEAMQPLYSIIFRFFRFLPVSNFYSETVVKTLVKTLHPTQRREEATASRWVAALHRDPSRLARLTTSAVDWARGVLKRRKQEAAQRREA